MRNAIEIQVPVWVGQDDYRELQERAKGFDTSVSTVAGHLLHKAIGERVKRKQPRLSKAQLVAMAEMLELGLTDRAIASALGVSRSTIANNKNRAIQ